MGSNVCVAGIRLASRSWRDAKKGMKKPRRLSALTFSLYWTLSDTNASIFGCCLTERVSTCSPGEDERDGIPAVHPACGADRLGKGRLALCGSARSLRLSLD